MFKNLMFYKLPTSWDVSAESLEEQLSRVPFVPCGSQDIKTVGFAPRDGVLVTSIGGQYLVHIEEEQKLLPSKAINQYAQKLAAEIESEQGYAPGRKQMRELKERALQELLPKALTVRGGTRVWINPEQGLFAVEAGSQSKADAVIELFSRALDTFPLKAFSTEESPTTWMVSRLLGDHADEFTVDRDCELKAISEEKAAVAYKRHPLEGDVSDEIKAHLAAGKLPTRLALTWNDRISFVLTEKLEIKRIVFLDLLKESAVEADSRDEQFEVDFVLYTGELSKMMDALVESMGGLSEES